MIADPLLRNLVTLALFVALVAGTVVVTRFNERRGQR